MEMKRYIQHLKDHIQEGRFMTEAAVSQGIVLPVLQKLGWPVFDICVVIPEFSVEGRRVDYALCHPGETPYIFVEVKRIGLTAGADRQLFEYAFHRGVPMAILTDGQEWNFYLPGEQGHYRERRVYKVDLLKQDVSETVNRLERYLGYGNVCSGAALKAARADYQDISKERIIESNFPKAWGALLKEQDSLLLEMLAEKVEDFCGYKPDLDLCSRYLDGVSNNLNGAAGTRPSEKASDTGFQSQPFLLMHEGKTLPVKSAVETMIHFFKLLYELDKSIFERFVSRKHGRKRRYLAQDKAELYPGRPDLVDMFSAEVAPGWWLGTNYSRKNIQDIIDLALQVAGPEVRDVVQARVI